MDNTETTTRHVPRRERQITQPITFNMTAYSALEAIKRWIREETGVHYSNSVIMRAIAIRTHERLAREPAYLEPLSQTAQECASRNKTPSRSGTNYKEAK